MSMVGDAFKASVAAFPDPGRAGKCNPRAGDFPSP
jgi:hypothetical protein